MDGVPRNIGLSPELVTPRGLGMCQVESLTGYAARMSARIAAPTLAFVGRAFQDAQGGDALPLRSAVVAAARRLNVGDCGSRVAVAMGRLTGQPDLDRLSHFAFLDLFGVGDRGVIAPHRRWCPKCWIDDRAEPYERKVWWLAFVDMCHLHACLLESRCPTCGRLQPTLPRGVRIHVCSHCGHDLYTCTVVPTGGTALNRLSSYAREGARLVSRAGRSFAGYCANMGGPSGAAVRHRYKDIAHGTLVHAGEVVPLTGSNESESLRLGYRRLADLAEQRGLLAVQRFFSHDIFPAKGSKIEALMSRPMAPRRQRRGALLPGGTGHDSGPAKPLTSFSWISATPPNAPITRRTPPTVQ